MEEESRKELQRQKQRAALKRQLEGGLTKKEIKKRRANGEKLPKLPKKKKKVHERESWKQQSDERAAAGAEAGFGFVGGEQVRPQHDVVVIPIFWRNIPGQEEAMVAEAQRIKGILRTATSGALDVWVDRTHKRTPGQKLNFWETQGVRWRVEVGPRDAAKQRCVISHQAGDAGDYSTVTKIPNVSTVKRYQLLSKLKGGLQMDKISAEAIESLREDPDGDRRQMDQALKNLAGGDDAGGGGGGGGGVDHDARGDATRGSAEKRSSKNDARKEQQPPSRDYKEPNAKERRAARRKHLHDPV